MRKELTAEGAEGKRENENIGRKKEKGKRKKE
jgi:hypothetical protein